MWSKSLLAKVKVKVKWIYRAPSRETSKTLRHGSHSVTCKLHHACLYLVSVHQMALPPTCDNVHLNRPRKDERPSQPGWLTYSGRFTHISGHPSAVGQAQDRESLPVKDRLSTAVPRNQNQPCHVPCQMGREHSY